MEKCPTIIKPMKSLTNITYETPNDSAYKEIMEFHNMTVNSAREQWTNRIEMISKFINS
jgi:hypothetical protein